MISDNYRISIVLRKKYSQTIIVMLTEVKFIKLFCMAYDLS